jgi:hypothetical protein
MKMRLVTAFHLSCGGVKAARVALAAGAVAGLAVLGACADNGGKAITAPANLRNATTSSGGFGQKQQLQVCVSAGSPAGTYTFHNIALNRSFAQDGFNNALVGNGSFDGTFWNDGGDGGTGTTVANKLVGDTYPLTPGGTCALVLNRTSGDLAFMAKLPVADGGSCTTSCGGVNDSFAAANVSPVSNTAGAVYDHTDCKLDNGVLMPEHPNPAVTWPSTGFDGTAPFLNYGCGTANSTTRGFVNFEHGATITYAFVTAPVQVIPLFVIGDIEAHGIGANVNFWGAQWWKNNPMSQFHTSGWPSFKGFASSVDLTPSNGNPCGTWTSRVGNSPPPPQTIPEFVGIIVTNNVIKSGPDLTGGIQQIIIVHSDGGYGPNPGHDGNGPVTSIVCPAG